jgi:2-methylisocitrate lyase-like PEP mutase family enzyme
MQLQHDDQHRRAVAFRALHAGPGTFVVPNPWDAGSARILSGLGFCALATTSAGIAYGLGLPDGSNQVGRAQALDNARAIVAATSLPVSADLESGYSDDPAGIAETIRLAASTATLTRSTASASGRIGAPARPVASSIDPPTRPASAASRIVSAMPAGSSL